MSRRIPTNTAIIIPAAGIGARLTNPERKAWVTLGGQPLLQHALSAFRAHRAVSEIILVVSPDDVERASHLIADGPAHITEKVVVGGAQRRDSVWAGLQEVTEGTEITLIHDAARPFISARVIDDCISAVERFGAAIVARPVADTLKRAAPDGSINATVDRAGLWGAQTPQGFRTRLLREAYGRAIREGWSVTDDAAVVEKCGHRVMLVEGEAQNFKVTLPEDLVLAERLISAGARVGFGYDVHRLVDGRALILGGVEVPHTHGLLGHSDADVLTHAIMDALLGASSLGDIGYHFPDTDSRFYGASSIALLGEVGALLSRAGMSIINIDATLAAEAPKIAPYITAMRERIASALEIPVPRVSVKATTTEGLGFVGTKEGMAAHAVASVIPSPGVARE